MRFYDCETQEFVTFDELREIFEADETLQTEYESLAAYVKCCDVSEGGTLIPVPETDEMDETLYICTETNEIVNRKQRDYMLIHDYFCDDSEIAYEAGFYFVEIPR